jgi:hypothetical protein
VVGLFLKCSEVTCPNPSLVFEGFENLPRFPNPHLLGPPDSLSFDLLRRGEQIPQVSVIMRLIPRSVHGASLKPSELI